MAVEMRRRGSAEPLLTLGLGRGPRTGLWKGLQIPRYPAHFFMGSVRWGAVERSGRGDTAGSGTCHLWPCLSFVPASSPSVLACKMKILTVLSSSGRLAGRARKALGIQQELNKCQLLSVEAWAEGRRGVRNNPRL